jgi:2,3-bisphosphoglycerate-dependent phosphoglycerate mutase
LAPERALGPAAAILLIRHCQSTGQSPDAPLTPAGRDDADRLGDQLTRLGVDAAYSSPYLRARSTLAPLVSRAGIALRLDDRLVERRLAAVELPDWLEHIRRSFEDLDHRAPGGESLREAQARGLAAIADIAGRGHRLPALCTHGNLLSAVLISMDACFGFEDWRQLRNPDLFMLACEGGRPLSYERHGEAEFDSSPANA